MSTVRLLGAIAISLCPLNCARRLLYRLLLGYRIDRHAHIGFMTVIAVDSATIESVTIGMFNKFVGPYNLIVRGRTTAEEVQRALSLVKNSRPVLGTVLNKAGQLSATPARMKELLSL